MNVQVKTISELATNELYALLQLRAEVFVVEQNCPYQDLDNHDQEGIHLLGYQDLSLVAYARILKPGTLYAEPSIGRVVTKQTARKIGLGKAIFKRALEETRQRFPKKPIRIMAQSYLIQFYEAFGFTVASGEFLEDGIPHVEMLG